MPYRMFIGGKFVEARNGATRDIINPANGKKLATVPEASVEDVHSAVQSARKAFDEGPWCETTAQQRGRILFAMADLVRKNAAKLAELETLNCGKPIVESEFDMVDTATCFEYY